jgi:hypothetical protein
MSLPFASYSPRLHDQKICPSVVRQSGDLVIDHPVITLPNSLNPQAPSIIASSDHGDHPITRDHGDYLAPVLPTFFFNFSPT